MDSAELSLLKCNMQTKVSAKDVSFLCRKRYFVAFMVFLGMIIVNVMGAHFGIVIVEMTTEKNVTIGDKLSIREPEFQWTQIQKGLLLGCYAFMFIFGFVGGILAKHYGGTRVFGLSIFLNGAFSMISPLVLKLSLLLFFIVRMLEGFFHILAFSSFLQVFVKWAPSNERFRMIDFSFSGALMGVIITFPVCGIILEKLSWHYIFFISGGAAVIWYFVWAFFIYEDPMKDKFISEDEKFFITENLEAASTKGVYPWKQILTSKAIWAYLNEKFVEAWSVSFAIQCLPLYIRDSFDVSIAEIGFISSVPHILNFVGILIGGPIGDFLRNKNILSQPNVYMALISTGQLTSVISLIIMGLSTNVVGSMLCICVLRFMYGIAESAYVVLPIDIAGEFAGLVNGLGFSIFTFGAVLNPIVMSLVVPNQSPTEWCHYFLLLSLFNVWAFIIFYFYGSGRPESWTAAGQKIQTEQVCEK